jgi:ribokinase
LRLELLTVGDAFHDLIFMGLSRLPRAGEEVHAADLVATIGGGAVITAIATARLGVRTRIVSALSADAARTLRTAGVSVVNVKRSSEAHAITAALSMRHDRSFVTFTGVNDRLQARLPAAVARQRARHVHFAFAPVDCARWARISERLRAGGTTTSWDFGWSPPLRSRTGFARLLRSADFIFVNELEAPLYAGLPPRRSPADFWRRAAANTIVKLGRRGSRWLSSELDVRAAAPRVRSVDTTGAGDAFNGGFLYAYLRGRAARECLTAGNIVGARSTLAGGGIASLPATVAVGEAGRVGQGGQVGRTRRTRVTALGRSTRPTRP